MNILIAVPAYGGSIKRLCSDRLIELAVTLTRRGISFSHSSMDAGDIAQVRNFYASAVLQDPAFTHLLMIDNDVVPTSAGILKMLGANKPIIGWAIPVRPNSGRKTELRFNIAGPVSDLDNGIAELPKVGTGVMLIQRGALEQLHATGKLRIQTTHEFESAITLHGFFDRIDHGGRLLGEDVSFCKRWRELCSGSVYALIDETAGHIGESVQTARFLDARPLPATQAGQTGQR